MSNHTIKALKTKAADRQNWNCYYCHKPMWDQDPSDFIRRYPMSIGQAARFRCTAEHLEARSDGGRNIESNIVAACQFCNQARHKTKRPRDPIGHAKLVRSRLANGRWHPSQNLPPNSQNGLAATRSRHPRKRHSESGETVDI
ncbi:HNH endonuclease [Rhizobium leguminosarum]|uniref:HNH endonuclease n=1 Tax=Rhizobium leguminosarum TaxID=384 RepID=UPI0010326080|nr:restriction endonuclease [Rhizobium leguminosarum]